MSKHQLYSITALFGTADELLHAVELTAKEGFTIFDSHTPFPVHGLDAKMKLPPSKLGYFALVFGLLGAVSAISFISWVTLVDYPLVIGGKPFWSWPAFVPISFEITVLLASVLTVLSMIIVYFKFPNMSHPLHDTPYMKHVSSDMFGISIQADDPKFDEKTVREFLKRVGGNGIAAVSYDLGDIQHGQKIFDLRFIGILAVVAVAVSGGTYFTLNVLLTMEPFNWMMNQNKMKPQSASALFADGIGMRPPADGTITRGHMPYPYKGKPDEAGKYLVNPLLASKEILIKGKDKFLTYCSPCHGNFGRGDSRLRGQFPNPPTLHSDKVRSWPDGNIFHVITDGQNIMPPYASQISAEDRWAVVHYIRLLERAHNAKESDLK